MKGFCSGPGLPIPLHFFGECQVNLGMLEKLHENSVGSNQCPGPPKDPSRGATFENVCASALVLLPGKFQEQKSLTGYSPWSHKESDMTEQLSTHTHAHTHTQAAKYPKELSSAWGHRWNFPFVSTTSSNSSYDAWFIHRFQLLFHVVLYQEMFCSTDFCSWWPYSYPWDCWISRLSIDETYHNTCYKGILSQSTL